MPTWLRRPTPRIVSDGVENLPPASAPMMFGIEVNQFQESAFEQKFANELARQGLSGMVPSGESGEPREQADAGFAELGAYLSQRRIKDQIRIVAARLLVEQLKEFPVRRSRRRPR